jgi:Pectate lyase superfamily protein
MVRVFNLPTIGQDPWGVALNIQALANLDGRIVRQAIDVVDFGAVGDGVTDDTVAIQAALSSAIPGQTVNLGPNSYVISSDLIVPPGVRLTGPYGQRTELGSGTDVASKAKLVMKSGFTGNAAISVIDKQLGSYANDNASVQIANLNIDGSAATGAFDGIQVNGKCDGLLIENVSIYKAPNCGVRLLQFQRVDTNFYKTINFVMTRVVVHNSTSDAFSFNGNTDAVVRDCYTLGSGGEGFILTTSCANMVLANCRSEWSTLNGYHITGSWNTGTGSGGVLFDGCSTDRNNRNGFLVDATGNSPIQISSPMCRRDGRNGGSGGGSYAALAVAAATVPVIINNPSVYPGVDDNGSGTNSPQYGINVTGTSTFMAVNGGGLLHAATTPWNDDGSNTTVVRGPGLVERTGTTSAPTAIVVYESPRPEWAADEVGYGAWNYDPIFIQTGSLLVSGTIQLLRMKIRRMIKVSNVVAYVSTAGATLTAAQNLIGLCTISGTTATRIAVTGDQSAVWTSTGRKVMALTGGPFIVPEGDVALAFLSVGTTPATFGRTNRIADNQLNNGNLGASGARWATNGTSQTSIPASFALGSNTNNSETIWVALS